MSDTVALVIQFAIPVVAGAAAGVCYAMARRWRQRAEYAAEAAAVAIDVLDRMEEAHDPGRDVQNRLAAVLEARIIISDGKTRPVPEARRAIAQEMAAQFIQDIRRADLVLSKGDANDG